MDLTPEANDELDRFLKVIEKHHGVQGIIVVDYDGSIIDSRMPSNTDTESVALCSLAIFLNSQTACRNLGAERIYTILFKSEQGYIQIADCGNGLLVTLTDQTNHLLKDTITGP